MDTYFNYKIYDKINGQNVRETINKFIDNARYINKMSITIDIDGNGGGVGTIYSYTYRITIKYLEDCCTY